MAERTKSSVEVADVDISVGEMTTVDRGPFAVVPQNDGLGSNYPISDDPEALRRADAVIDEIELMGILMDRDWLGLQILSSLQAQDAPSLVTELADAAGVPTDTCAATLARLYRYDALSLVGDRFALSERARFILQRAEAIAQEQAAGTSE